MDISVLSFENEEKKMGGNEVDDDDEEDNAEGKTSGKDMNVKISKGTGGRPRGRPRRRGLPPVQPSRTRVSVCGSHL